LPLYSQSENYAMVPAEGTLVELLHDHKGELDLGFNGRQALTWQMMMGKALSNAVDRVFEANDGAGGTVKVRIGKSRASSGMAYRLELVS
jgi:hypothetical protein